MCSPAPGVETEAARQTIAEQIEDIPLPTGYSIRWDGEKGARDQTMYWLFKQVPLAVVLIIAVLILLFGDYRKPTIVLCCIPLLAVGIVGAMLLTGKTFDFCAIVGALGLMGMLIKNLHRIVGRNRPAVQRRYRPHSRTGRQRPKSSAACDDGFAYHHSRYDSAARRCDVRFNGCDDHGRTVLFDHRHVVVSADTLRPVFQNQNEIIRFGRRPYLTVRAAPMRRERCRYSTSASNNCNTMFARSSAQGRTTGANGPGFHYL